MMWKFPHIFLPLILITLLCLFFPSMTFPAPPVRVGIVTDGPYEHLDDELRLIRKEILELTRGDFDVRFPENKLLVSDWTVPGVRSAFTRLLEDPDVDMVLTWGALGSHQAGINPDLPKPVVAPFVIDREIQGFPFHNGSSGARNLVYIASHIPLGRHLEAFQDLVPFTELGFIYNPVYTETIPELEQIMLRAVAASGMKAVPVPLRETMDETLSSIPESVEAVFITPLITPGSAQFQKLVTGFKDRRLPSFSVLGKEEVEKAFSQASPRERT